MKLNNKGYMLVEVIVASAIALVMAYFLVDITITLINKNNDYYIESTLITDKNLITKEIMDDVNNPDYSLIGISVNIEGDVTSAELDYKNINDNSSLKRELIINKNTNEIEYGEYTKKLDDILTIRDFKIEKDENQKQLYISIPAYTNYSDVDYGLNLIIPYTNDLEITIPEANYCDLTSGTPNSPDLVDGLIPVAYDESKNSWVKADSTNKNNSWYNYCDKKWANAVLVTDTNRNSYKNASAGTKIIESDILAFYVWIPRYKYKVWNISKKVGVSSYDAYHNGIDIVFENEKQKTGTINCAYNYNVSRIDLSTTPAESCTGNNDDYYTHPAFTFGNSNIRGFWISKFEISSSNPTVTDGGGNATNLTVRILPNVPSWRNITLNNINTVIQNMQISNNIYGLSTSRANTDSHILTNYEWGAVAYLTNSRHGKCTAGSCTEIIKNNCSSNITGIGADNASDSRSSTTCNATVNKYNGAKGVLASTTGNITGVYDMSGGAYEYVMGNISNVTTEYTFYSSESGFANSWYTTNTAKYLTTYAYDTIDDNQKAYNRGRLGDATVETLLSATYTGGWYSDYASFPCSIRSWFIRGGDHSNGYYAGMFDFNFAFGDKSSGASSRAILVSLK